MIAAKGINMTTRIAITTSALVALCATQQIAHSETVSITGDIQGETCDLRVFNAIDNSRVFGTNISMPIGNIPLDTVSDKAAAGTRIGGGYSIFF